MKTQRDTPYLLAIDISMSCKPNINKKVLEPSCGNGTIVKYLLKYGYSDITAIELNKDKINFVKKEYPTVNCIHGDFMNIHFDHKFGSIFAMPPFKDNIDLHHIMKMYDLLDSDGQMITGVSNKFMYNNEEIHIEFRKWLESKQYSLTMLPDNTFMEKGKTVHTFLLKITK